MSILTAHDFASQMIAQARILDPNISGEVGTPERKIFDTVAISLADNQIDLTGLQSALDIDSKFGAGLDRFTALFGFQRQQAGAASGFVVFSRTTPAPTNVTIPVNTTLQSVQAGTSGQTMQFVTTAGGIIATNQTVSGAIPVQCIVSGSQGNVSADTITMMVGTLVTGVTAVTNPNALTNGIDAEDDNSFKVRFKNTWARNLAGTQAQYLALAVAGAFTTKANVIGVQSRYQEYTQVPDYDDAGYLDGVLSAPQSTLGTQNSWTTALSSIPYAKEIYTDTQVYVSNGQQGLTQYYYRPDVDFRFNKVPLIYGDTVRVVRTETDVSQTPGAGPTHLTVKTVMGLPTAGSFIVANNAGAVQTITYTGVTVSTNQLTGCSSVVGTIDPNTPVYILPVVTAVRPNFTILNVYNPSGPDLIPGIQAMAPQDVVLTEFSYISSASRNTLNHNVVNAVDVYVNGTNDMHASCIFLPNALQQQFVNVPTSPWYYENFRRDGQPTKRPQLNNYFTSLFQTPLTALPDTITINAENYYLGYHYWLIHEVSNIGGTVRARDGIEWDKDLLGDLGAYPAPTTPDLAAADLTPYWPLGGTQIGAILPSLGIGVEVNDYTFDSNIPTLQAAIEDARPVTTDALVHKASTRYFKLDITVSYSPNSNYAVVNAAIGTTVQAYFDRQYFGSIVQLSDLLEIVHEVPGVDNVRWSNDIILVPDLIRVLETDSQGNPLHGVTVDRLNTNPGAIEKQTLYLDGSPTGSFTLSWTDPILPTTHTITTAPISFFDDHEIPVTAAIIQAAIRAVQPPSGIYNTISVTEDVRPTINVPRPMRSFTIIYGGTGQPMLPTITSTITASSFAFDSDFFLLDDELPSLPLATTAGDTVPGIIIRPRAQSTFFRPGLG